MLEMKITELTNAINSLAVALGAARDTSSASAAPTPAAVPCVPEQTAPPVAAAPVVPTVSAAVPVAPAVPTAAPQYTLDQLAMAGATLVDAGKLEALQALLARYNVLAITQLAPDQYGAFATEMRALGAQL